MIVTRRSWVDTSRLRAAVEGVVPVLGDLLADLGGRQSRLTHAALLHTIVPASLDHGPSRPRRRPPHRMTTDAGNDIQASRGAANRTTDAGGFARPGLVRSSGARRRLVSTGLGDQRPARTSR